MQLVVLFLNDTILKSTVSDCLRQRGKEGFVFFSERTIEGSNMLSESLTIDIVVVTVKATSHRVEERVSKMSCIVCLIGRVLDTIVLPNDSTKVVSCLLQGKFHLIYGIGLLQEMHVTAHLCAVLHDITDIIPHFLLVGCELQLGMSKGCTTHTFRLWFGSDRLSFAEGV